MSGRQITIGVLLEPMGPWMIEWCDALGLHSGPLSSEQFAQGILDCVLNELGHFLYEYQGTGGPLI
jgi:hypothetical protein